MSEQQYTIEEKLAEVVRELDFRREVYPFRVKMKVMRQEEADRRIAILAGRLPKITTKYSTQPKAMEMMRTIELPSSQLLGHRWTAQWRVGFPPGSSRAQADAVAREEFGTDRRGAKRSRRAAAGSSLGASAHATVRSSTPRTAPK